MPDKPLIGIVEKSKKPLSSKERDNAFDALVKGGLIKKRDDKFHLNASLLLPELTSICRRGGYSKFRRNIQVKLVATSLIIKCTGPCTGVEGSARYAVLKKLRISDLIREFLEKLKYPSGKEGYSSSTTTQTPKDALLVWNGSK